MLLFKILCVKEGIEGEVITDDITTEIWKQEKECKDAFNIKKRTVGCWRSRSGVTCADCRWNNSIIFKNKEV